MKYNNVGKKCSKLHKKNNDKINKIDSAEFKNLSSKIKNEKKYDICRKNIILIGVVFTLLSSIAAILVNYFNKHNNTILSAVTTILMSLIPVGIVSIAYGYFNSLEFTRERIKEVLFEDEGYINLSEKIKMKIKNNIEKDLLMDEIDSANSLLTIVQQEIHPLINKCYFSEHIITVDCVREDSQIVKHIEETIIIMKPKLSLPIPKQEIKLQDIFGIKSFGQDSNECKNKGDSINTDHCDQCNKKCVDLEKLIIDGRSFKIGEDYERVLTPTGDFEDIPDFNKRFSYEFLKPLAVDDCPVEIRLNYTTRVDETDKVFVHKIKIPTKNYTMHFNYEKDKMKITPVGFGFMTDMGNSFKRIVKGKYINGIKVRLKDWALPGNGVFVAIELL